MSDFKKKTLAATIGTTFIATLAGQAGAADGGNPFSMTELESGYMVADKGGKAQGKCGTGKCGANKRAAKKKAEGNCGGRKAGGPEGNCGANKVREAAKEAEGNCGGKAGDKAGDKAGEMKKEMEGACGAGA